MKIFSDGLTRIAKLGLLALAGLLSVLCVISLASRHAGHRKLSGLIDRYRTANQDAQVAPDGKNPSKATSPQEECVKRITDRNVFSPPKKKAFSAKLLGVLGDAAIFAPDKFVKVGESISGAKVMEIGSDWVQLEYEGKPLKLSVFGPGDAAAGPSGPSMPSGPMGAQRGAMVVSGGGPPRMPPSGFKIPPEMIERLKQASPEEREKALSRMPPEIREKIKQAM